MRQSVQLAAALLQKSFDLDLHRRLQRPHGCGGQRAGLPGRVPGYRAVCECVLGHDRETLGGSACSPGGRQGADNRAPEGIDGRAHAGCQLPVLETRRNHLQVRTIVALAPSPPAMINQPVPEPDEGFNNSCFN